MARPSLARFHPQLHQGDAGEAGQGLTDAGYFVLNVRVVEVLIDQDAIKSGAAAASDGWKFYDLGHGYCTYDFFDQCLHRMAWAKCSFYCPEGSSGAMLLEGKANLLTCSSRFRSLTMSAQRLKMAFRPSRDCWPS